MQALIQTLQDQNAVQPSGVVEPVRSASAFASAAIFSEENIAAINLRVNDRFFRLSDVARSVGSFTDPPSMLFRYDGERRWRSPSP